MLIVNAFALRSTDPRVLLGHHDPVGPGNLAQLRRATMGVRFVVVGWGAHPAMRREFGGRRHVDAVMEALGVPLQCLGVTKRGDPRHPLYLPKDAPLTRWPS